MSIKQLLLVSALCTFSAQAMQEVKENQEVQKHDKFQAIKESCPNSIKFLIKILGQQKDVGQSSVIKKGLPEDLIYKIIDEYLKVNLYKYPMSRNEMRISTDFNQMIEDLKSPMDGVFSEDISDHVYRTTITIKGDLSYSVIFSVRGLSYIGRVTWFRTMNRPVLDINPDVYNEVQPNLRDKIYLRIKNEIKTIITDPAFPAISSMFLALALVFLNRG